VPFHANDITVLFINTKLWAQRNTRLKNFHKQNLRVESLKNFPYFYFPNQKYSKNFYTNFDILKIKGKEEIRNNKNNKKRLPIYRYIGGLKNSKKSIKRTRGDCLVLRMINYNY